MTTIIIRSCLDEIDRLDAELETAARTIAELRADRAAIIEALEKDLDLINPGDFFATERAIQSPDHTLACHWQRISPMAVATGCGHEPTVSQDPARRGWEYCPHCGGKIDYHADSQL